MAGLVTRLAAKVADTWVKRVGETKFRWGWKRKKERKKNKQTTNRLFMRLFETHKKSWIVTNWFIWSISHQTICCAPLMFLRDVCHIGKDHREGNGKNAGHGDNRKVPPGGGKQFGLWTQNKNGKTDPLHCKLKINNYIVIFVKGSVWGICNRLHYRVASTETE